MRHPFRLPLQASRKQCPHGTTAGPVAASPLPHVPVAEAVESRRLYAATTSTWTADSLSDLSGTYDAAIQFGANGNPSGTPTAEMTRSGTLLAYSYTSWDGNLDDGVDSGWTGVQLAINAGGGGSLEVSDSGAKAFGTTPSTAGAGGGGGISQVTIQAGVTGAFMAMSWRDLTVNFYRGGQLIESVTPADLAADTMDATTNDPAESGVVVSAAAGSDYDAVTVTGEIRLQTAAGTYPTDTDIFGQILVS